VIRPEEARAALRLTPVEELQAAFGKYATATGWLWKVRIRPPDRSGTSAEADPPVVRIDLNRDDARALADLLQDAAEPEGDTPRGPIGSWIGTADAAKILDVVPSTIRGWVTRNGPKTNPFPPPDLVYRGRSYWQKRTIDKWRARQRRIEKQRSQSRHRA
jgi:hypothetical protein